MKAVDKDQVWVVEWSERQRCTNVTSLAQSLAFNEHMVNQREGVPAYVIVAVRKTRDEARAAAEDLGPWLREQAAAAAAKARPAPRRRRPPPADLRAHPGQVGARPVLEVGDHRGERAPGQAPQPQRVSMVWTS